MMLALLVALLVQDDPGKLGKLSYKEYEVRIPRAKAGEAVTRIFHPADTKGPLPAIVFSPGGDAETYEGYEGFGRWFASWGYVCAIVGFDNGSAEERGAQYSEVADWLVKHASEEKSAIRGLVDPGGFVAMGHSRGGWASIVAAKKDKRFVACVAMAPSGPDKVEGENAPAVCFISGDDGDEKKCEALYKQFAKPRAQVTVEGMDHMFSSRTGGRATVVIKYATAFLNAHVKKDARFLEHLKAGEGVLVVRED